MADSKRKRMTESQTANSKTPVPQDTLLRRWSFFFVYLLFFPALLQLIFGAFSFSPEEWGNWFGGLLFRGIPGALLLLAALRLPRRAAPFLMGAVCAAAALFNLLDIFLLVNFGTLFDCGTLQLMCIAPAGEVRGFFQLFFMRLTTWVILLLYPAAGAVIFTVKKQKPLWCILTILTLTVLIFFNCTARESKSQVPSPAARMKHFLQSWQKSRRQITMESTAAALQVSNSDKEALYLLIIGESHSRRRSSLYGAQRDTTPQLKKLFLSRRIFRFDNAVTPHVMTHLALPGMLTLAGKDIDNFYKYPSLPDIFRKAGFKVWYLYNQMPDSESALPFLAAAKRADHFISFSNPVIGYDFQMMDKVEKILGSPGSKKLLILHLKGNHWKYAETFPEKMGYFSRTGGNSPKERLLNEYDDSLRALDAFLFQMLQLLQAQKKNAFLLYLPDHGEALYEEDDFAGHTDLFPTAASAELPMFLWFSPDFARPELLAAVQKNLKTPFLSSDLPHFFMELAGITSPLFAPERSFINPRYKKTPRHVSTRSIDYETMKNKSFPISEPQ